MSGTGINLPTIDDETLDVPRRNAKKALKFTLTILAMPMITLGVKDALTQGNKRTNSYFMLIT